MGQYNITLIIKRHNITRSGSVLTGQIPPAGTIFQDIKISNLFFKIKKKLKKKIKKKKRKKKRKKVS